MPKSFEIIHSRIFCSCTRAVYAYHEHLFHVSHFILNGFYGKISINYMIRFSKAIVFSIQSERSLFNANYIFRAVVFFFLLCSSGSSRCRCCSHAVCGKDCVFFFPSSILMHGIALNSIGIH